MKDIKKALEQDDICVAMREIGFTLMFYDEEDYPDDYLFLDEHDRWIVLFRNDLKEFWTYSKSNHSHVGNVHRKNEGK